MLFDDQRYFCKSISAMRRDLMGFSFMLPHANSMQQSVMDSQRPCNLCLFKTFDLIALNVIVILTPPHSVPL